MYINIVFVLFIFVTSIYYIFDLIRLTHIIETRSIIYE